MARPTEGWKLRWKGDRPATVRFTVDGREREVSTGEREPARAAEEAERIYAAAVSGRLQRRRRAAHGGVSLEGVFTSWLTEAPIDPRTASIYALYGEAHLIPAFDTLGEVTPESVARYIRARLRVVQAGTVRKELSALRGAVAWAVEQGFLSEAPLLPGVPKRAPGTRYQRPSRQRADQLSPAEVQAIIGALPERAPRGGYPVRARFIVAYEAGLRPSVLDVLSVPEHYERERPLLVIPFEHDKDSRERRLPLTPRAAGALDSVAPETGLIFGAHRYTTHVKSAAREVLGQQRGDRFSGAHLRSARITHWLEEPSSTLAGAQWLACHSRASTTDGYVRASERAARRMLGLDE